MATGDDTYDLADEPPTPAQPIHVQPPQPTQAVQPVTAAPLPYARASTPKAAAREADEASSAHFPDRHRDFIWPLVIAVIGIALLYAPALRSPSIEAFVATSCYLFVKCLIMLGIFWSLALILRFSFGTLASAALKVLAIVAATDGWMFGIFEFDSACAGLFLGLIGSIAICAACIWKLTELEADEIALTTALYWFPSLGFSWLIYRATAWLMEWVV